ncbi:MAG TPA: CoA transferase [Vicinamibacterales bacterium]|nr:CoA transferase [Vicinamibacterales bacterium]
MSAAGPLAGLTIVDLTRVLSGPYCTMLLGDLGARVIKIEQPERGDDTRAWGPPFVGGESTYFLSVNRNKESVTLDFKTRAGRDVLDQLIARADILVENFRPGTLARLGLDYPSLAAAHPRLIYCSISGFGHSGPRAAQPGYDAVLQAEGGLMSITGDAGGPPFRLGVAIADLAAGLLASNGVALALYARERTGRGQFVDIAMFDTVVSLLSYQASAWLNGEHAAARIGNRHPQIAPYDVFDASDGAFFLAVGNDDQFQRLCRLTGLETLATDERFATNPARVAHYPQVRDRLAVALRERTRAEWIERLMAAGVPCGAVRDVADVLADPQVAARSMIAAVEHAAAGMVKVLGPPLKMSDAPATVRSAPPVLGQHTVTVLRELGLQPEDIEALRRERVIT